MALGEIQRNHQDHGPRSPTKQKDDARGRSKSPTKSSFPSLRSMGDRWGSDKSAVSREASPTKQPKSKKSSTNLVGLLSRPKSFINLQRTSTEDKRTTSTGDKENRRPEPAAVTETPPIYAQFSSTHSDKAQKARPQSCHPSLQASPAGGLGSQPPSKAVQTASQEEARGRPVSTSGHGHVRAKSVAAEPAMEASEIAKHLEALLDRRNIPQNQRYKMRNLNDTIKMEFIRQDWAEMKAGQAGGSPPRSETKTSTAVESDPEEDASSKRARGRSRGRSFTFSRSKRDRSSSKKAPKTDGSIGRRFRSKSTESIGRDRPESSGSSSGVLSKIKFQQGPSDYVAYLRKVQKPELVEVGKLHKLRLLLRNETVAWTEEFIRQGGLEEIVSLLNRIMEVEWR